MNRIIHFFLLVAVLGSSFTFGEEYRDSSSAKKLVIIPVNGVVNSSMAAFIGRVVRENKGTSERVFILEMDTFGGEVASAFSIVDTLLNVGDIQTIAYVKTKAISAGALIALACDNVIMKRSTTIGAVAPLMMSNDGPKMLGEKFQSPIRAKFRSLARRNGYSPLLAEAMVTDEFTVYRVTFSDTVLYLDSTAYAELSVEQTDDVIDVRTVVRKGELLTMDDDEAYEFGFSLGSVSSIDELVSSMNFSDYEVIRYRRSWSEKMVAIIAKLAPILMMIGFAALYIEIRTPGFGIPGIIGIFFLVLVFSSQYMVGLADYTELLLLAIGVVLLAVEVFVLPGFGIAGILGILFLFIAMVLSMQEFVIPRPEFPWEKLKLIRNLTYGMGSLLGSIVLIVLFFRFVFPKIGKLISGPYLAASLKEAHCDTNTEWVLHVGDQGTVITPLRPSGKAEIHGMLCDVVAEGMFIEIGEEITVTFVSGNRVVVEKEM